MQKSKLDAMVQTEDGFSYIFQGNLYWRLTDKRLASGYPRNFSTYWPGLPAGIDAALYWPTNQRTYFFKGNKYWKFHNKNPDEGYPRFIWQGFRGVPGNIDAALTWSENNKIYFFKGSQYWKYDPDQANPVSPMYPKSIANNWGVDGGFQLEKLKNLLLQEQRLFPVQ